MGERSFRNPKSNGARLVGYKVAADLAGKGVTFVVTVAAARALTRQAFGVFALASTLGWMLAVASDFGIQLHVARAIARRPESAGDTLAVWLRVRLWTTAAAVALVMLGLTVFGVRADVAVPLVLFALVYGCSGIVEFLHYVYRGLSRSDVESSLIVAQRALTLALALAALAWRPSVTALAAAMLLPIAAALAVSVWLARRITAAAAVGERGDPAASTVSFESFGRDVFPIGAGIVLSALYFRVDVFLVEWWRGTEAVALYNAVFRLIEALRLFPAAVLAVALPTLCRARDRAPLVRVAGAVTLFAVAVAAVLWATSDRLVPLLYGRTYAGGASAFRILTLAFPLLSLNYALTHQLIAWNGQRAYAVLCGAALAVNVALNATLIPTASIDGAAWATVATEAFLTFGCVWALSTRTTVPDDVAAAGLPA